MALKLTVDKLDDIDEPARPFYEEKNGKFVLALDGFEDPSPIKRNLEQARRAERDHKKKIDQWETLGKTPEEIAEALGKLQELEAAVGDNKDMETKIEAFKAQWLEKNQTKLTQLEKQLNDTKAERDKEKLERDRDRLSAVIDRAIVASKGKLGLRYIVERFVKIERDGNQTKFVVTDENGTDRYNIGGPNDGKPMTITELLAEMAGSEDYAGNFEGSGNSGGGSKPAAGGGKASPLGVRKKSDIGTGKEGARKLAAFIDAFPNPDDGQKAYQALPD